LAAAGRAIEFTRRLERPTSKPSLDGEKRRRIVALAIGAFLAIAVGLLATVSRLDRDRAFYPTVAIVVASYYALFAIMGASSHALVLETLAGAVFLAAALLGFRSSLWIVVLALAGHGIFDLIHARVISNPGVPSWWPPFCLSYDVVAAGYLAWRLKSRRIPITM
jgi:hypothetical protein